VVEPSFTSAAVVSSYGKPQPFRREKQSYVTSSSSGLLYYRSTSLEGEVLVTEAQATSASPKTSFSQLILLPVAATQE